MANYLLKPGEKARTVTTIVWVEQLEKRWGDHWAKHWYGYLADLRCMVACSPLHDKDTYSEEDVRNWVRRHIDPDTGEVATEFTNAQPRVGDAKKAHFHVVLIVKGPQTREDFSAIMLDVVWISPTAWQRVVHLDSMTRYLAHMDNPEKFQYSVFDIQGWGGYNLKPLTIQKSDEYTKAMAFASVMDYIEENDVKYYHHLMKWAKALGDYDIFSCVAGRFGAFVAYFRDVAREKADKEAAKKSREKAEQNITES